MKGFRVASYISSSFPKLSWRKAILNYSHPEREEKGEE
jgi:hypothetical protein